MIQQYTISITELETQTTEMFNATEEAIVISDQHPFYRYIYSVAAETIVGQGPFSVARMVHLPEAGKRELVSMWCDCGHCLFMDIDYSAWRLAFLLN